MTHVEEYIYIYFDDVVAVADPVMLRERETKKNRFFTTTTTAVDTSMEEVRRNR